MQRRVMLKFEFGLPIPPWMSWTLAQHMKPCCDRFAEVANKERSPIRIDAYGCAFLVSDMEGYAMEQAISYCMFCGADISIKDTHRLEDAMSADSEFRICFADGTEMVVKECTPIDFSIYHKTGGWSGSVIGFTGNEKQRQLFKTGSRIDFYEEDIVSIRNTQTGEIVYQNNRANDADHRTPDSL